MKQTFNVSKHHHHYSLLDSKFGTKEFHMKGEGVC